MFPPSYFVYILPENIAINTLHILASLERLIEDSILIDALSSKVIEPKLPEGLPGLGGPGRAMSKAALGLHRASRELAGFGGPRQSNYKARLHHGQRAPAE